MAFTGAAVFQQVTDRCVRITGLSLAGAASGILGLFGSTVVGAVALPAAFKPRPTTYNDTAVSLIELIRVNVLPMGSAQAATAVPLRVVKAGATQVLFSITFTNDDAAAATSDDLEIYVFFD